MKITKQEDNLIVEIPLKQPISNPYEDRDLGECDNLVGIIAGDEFTISQLIDMDYKDKPPQEGMPILHFTTEEQLRDVCKEFDIDIWEHPLCAYCKKVIRGSFTLGEKGNMCNTCELEKND